MASAGRKCNPPSWQGQSPKNRPEGDLPLKNLAGRPRRICQPGPPDSLGGTPNCKRYQCTFPGEQGPRGPQPQTLLEAPPTQKPQMVVGVGSSFSFPSPVPFLTVLTRHSAGGGHANGQRRSRQFTGLDIRGLGFRVQDVDESCLGATSAHQ